MNKLSFIIILASFLTSCTNNKQTSLTEISVSIPPQRYLIQQLLGDSTAVNVMIPIGANHATYAPSPAQLAKLANSKIYIKLGFLNFETAWEENFTKVNNKMRWVDLSKGIEPIYGEHDHSHDGHECNGGKDPHTWTSPKQMQLIFENLKNTLIKEFPDKKNNIIANYNSFSSQIDSLAQRCIRLSQEKPDLHFMIFHPAYSYLARDYGFTQLNIEYEGKTPTPAYLKKTIELAIEKNIKTIFIQKEFDINNARVIAKEIDATPVQVNPMAENWLAEMDLFISYLEKN